MQFFNTAVLLLVANLQLPPLKSLFSSMGSVSSFIPVLNGLYKDVSIEWHKNVGNLICMSLVAHVVVNTILTVLKYSIFLCCRKVRKAA